ncbi:MAG: hypothetical protein QOF76_5556 [Solirubrobacteraceae bacterium]|jgi:hypothetical protein|nr:hypothetical protein [Solirubrobacteraceae bacterium]
MTRSTAFLTTFATVAVVAVTGCGSSSGGGGSAATKPTFDDVQQIAKQQLKDSGCKFKVKDQSQKGLDDELLECLITVQGQPKEYTVFHYTNDTDGEDSGFGGFTTADRYFQNGTIKVDASAASEQGQPALDAAGFSDAIKSACGCGAVKTPES